jgi:branched-chain amino acid transport system permease protein
MATVDSATAGPVPVAQEKLRLVRTTPGRVAVVVLAVAIVALPLNIGSTYWLGVLNAAGIAGIAGLGLNVLTGYAGQLSLGHATFVMVGAFTAQYLGGSRHLPMVLWLPLCAVVAGALGACIAPFALRLRGPYLAIVSLGVVYIGIYAAENLPTITGGLVGTAVTAEARLGPVNFERLSVGSLYFEREQGLFILIWTVLAVLVLLVANVMRTRSGRAMQAVRDHDVAAEVLGVRMFRTQTNAFVLATAIAGIAGGLLAIQLQYIRASNFDVALSVQYLAIIVIGGLASLWGPAIGAVFVTLVPVLVDYVSDALPFMAHGDVRGLSTTDLSLILYGCLIVTFLVIEPGGLVALSSRIARALRRPRARKQ